LDTVAEQWPSSQHVISVKEQEDSNNTGFDRRIISDTQLPYSQAKVVTIYGLKACPLTKSDLQSMDFVINRFCMKLFKTCNMDIVKYCQHCFSFDMPSDLWEKRARTFECKFSEFCQYIP